MGKRERERERETKREKKRLKLCSCQGGWEGKKFFFFCKLHTIVLVLVFLVLI